MMNEQVVIDFWFNPEHRPLWFEKNNDFDQKICAKFTQIHDRATRAELWDWRDRPLGRLAEIIILDQFSRNIFRNQPQAFAYDNMALLLAQEAILLQQDQDVSVEQRFFFYLPFMHSESPLIHQTAIKLFEKLGNPTYLDFEKKHKMIIDRFGRYPHRNAILGRISSEEELQFLQQADSHF